MTHEVVEVLCNQGGLARATQLAVEVLCKNLPVIVPAYVTQIAVEVLCRAETSARQPVVVICM